MELHNIGNDNSFTLFKEKFLSVLNKEAPFKSKLLRCNKNVFMSKESRKSLMLRSKLKNIFNKKCAMKRKAKGNFFRNLNKETLCDNKILLKKIKPDFSDKGNMCNKIMLVMKEQNVQKDENVPELMNNYFFQIRKTLNLKLSKNSSSHYHGVDISI